MATIYEVAKQAGVSPKTAARILAGDSMRSKNMERVLAAAKKLGYVRNQQAATLRSGRSGIIGLVIPSINNPVYTQFVESFQNACRSNAYNILLTSNFGKAGEEANALNSLQSYRADGVFLNAAENALDKSSTLLIEDFLSKNKPVVLAGLSKSSLKVDRISIADKRAVKKAVEYLIKTGRRKIAFAGSIKQRSAIQNRLSGYLDGLKDAGLKQDEHWITSGDSTSEDGIKSAHLLCKNSRKRPNAIIASNDLVAYGLIRGCFELGLKVPDDVAIIGFDDIAHSKTFCPSLTTLRQPQEQIARDVVELMLERIHNGDVSTPKVLEYDPELIIRESA